MIPGRNCFCLFLFSFFLFLSSCRNAADKIKVHSLRAELSSPTLHINEELIVNIPGEFAIDSLLFTGNSPLNVSEDNHRLVFRFASAGTHTIHITAYTPAGKREGSFPLLVIPRSPPAELEYTIVEVFPHNEDFYTQGLEFYNGFLYECRGEFGHSALMKIDFPSGKILGEVKLDEREFGEGITFVRDTLYQLTWRAGKCYLYNSDLEKIAERPLPTKEGWGLAFNGEYLLLSDGSHKIYVLNSDLSIHSVQEIYAGKNPVRELNELEFAREKIYANVYRSDQIYIIDLATGVTEYFVDLSSLRRHLKNPKAEVLNGIAYFSEKDQFLVTGKYWDKSFLIEIEH